jgi:predicted homoserine dehydrogenase-like protein
MQLNQVRVVPAEVAKWQAKKVGVLGAGMMGAGLPTQPQSKAFPYSKMCL